MQNIKPGLDGLSFKSLVLILIVSNIAALFSFVLICGASLTPIIIPPSQQNYTNCANLRVVKEGFRRRYKITFNKLHLRGRDQYPIYFPLTCKRAAVMEISFCQEYNKEAAIQIWGFTFMSYRPCFTHDQWEPHDFVMMWHVPMGPEHFYKPYFFMICSLNQTTFKYNDPLRVPDTEILQNDNYKWRNFI